MNIRHAGRLLVTLLLAGVLSACGGGGGGGGVVEPSESTVTTTSISSKTTSTTGGGGSSEVSVSTEVNFGQPFAEDPPPVSDRLGPVTLLVEFPRSAGSQMVITVTNTGATPVQQVRTATTIEVVADPAPSASGPEPQPPVTDLVTSVAGDSGVACTRGASPERADVRCDLGDLAPGVVARVTISVAGSPQVAVTTRLQAALGP